MNKIKLKAIYVNVCIMFSSPEDEFKKICRESAVRGENPAPCRLLCPNRSMLEYHWWNPIIPVFPGKVMTRPLTRLHD